MIHIEQLIKMYSIAGNDLLSTISDEDKLALASAMYLGREHIHSERVREDLLDDFNRNYVDHLDADSCCTAITGKSIQSVNKYFEVFLTCANNSKINLDEF